MAKFKETSMGAIFQNRVQEYGDKILSFLPLAHSLERTVGYYAPIFLGHKVAFAESMEKLLENFREIRPTFLVSVPRIYEKIHTGIKAKAAGAEFLIGMGVKILEGFGLTETTKEVHPIGG